jgi:hypothetical protein
MAEQERKIEERYRREEEESKKLFGRAAIRAYQRSRQQDSQRGRDVQYEDGDYKIRVKNGYQWKGDKYTTDVVVVDRRTRKGAHWHVVFDENGNILHQGWTNNRG